MYFTKTDGEERVPLSPRTKKEETSCLRKASKSPAVWAAILTLLAIVAAAALAVVVVKPAWASKSEDSAEGDDSVNLVNGPTDSSSPTPEPTALSNSGVETPVIGYYSWSWNAGSQGPSNANIGCAFTGYTDVDASIANWNSAASPVLKGTKYLTLGGGNDLGKFTATDLTSIAASASKIQAAGYAGVMFDVEHAEGASSTLIPLFAQAFANMKAAGLFVAITTSHTAPYQTDTPQDAIALVQAWTQDSNVDIISPQLYSSGLESAPEFAATWTCSTAGCTWDMYQNSIPIVAPSIVAASHYQSSVDYFQQNYGITLGGYLIWEQL